MKWIPLDNEQQLDAIKKISSHQPQLIFKHSTRCSISTMAMNRLERSNVPDNVQFHFLDLIRFRELSGRIASDFGVNHESPQVLLIKNGECIYDESHGGISMKEIEEQANG